MCKEKLEARKAAIEKEFVALKQAMTKAEVRAVQLQGAFAEVEALLKACKCEEAPKEPELSEAS